VNNGLNSFVESNGFGDFKQQGVKGQDSAKLWLRLEYSASLESGQGNFRLKL
jgi:hypothetical protein